MAPDPWPPAWTDEVIALAPAQPMAARVYGRADGSGAKPWVLHLHGGAFRAGSPACGCKVASVLCTAGAMVVSVAYPCGQAYPFPQALEMTFLVLGWMQSQRGRARQRHKLFVAGEEAGGNLAAALALVARDRQGPALAGQILLSPMLDPRLATCSFRGAEAGTAACKWSQGWHDYLGSPDKACHPYAAPAGALRLAGVAPALVLTGPNDPMRDEALAYAERLRASGVRVDCQEISRSAPWPCALAGPMTGVPDWAPDVRTAIAAFIGTTNTL